MKKLNLAWFVQFGMALGSVASLELPEIEMTPQLRYEFGRLKEFLTALLDEKGLPLSLKASRPKARELIHAIDQSLQEGQDEGVVNGHIYGVYFVAQDFMTLLNGEMPFQSVYNIWPKRAYNTDVLLESAVSLFSEKCRQQFNLDELYNLEQAGRCLAFEIPTGAAFHIIRAAESVLRRYYAVVVGTVPKPKMRNWGVYNQKPKSGRR